MKPLHKPVPADNDIQISLGAGWQRFAFATPGLIYLGTIRRGLEIGALARDATGAYLQVNGDIHQALNKSRVAAHLRKVGARPDPAAVAHSPTTETERPAVSVIVKRRRRILTPPASTANHLRSAKLASLPIHANPLGSLDLDQLNVSLTPPISPMDTQFSAPATRAAIAQLAAGGEPADISQLAQSLGIGLAALEGLAQRAYPLSGRDVAAQHLLRDLGRMLRAKTRSVGFKAALAELSAATSDPNPQHLTNESACNSPRGAHRTR